MEPHEELARIKQLRAIADMPRVVLEWQFIQALELIERQNKIIKQRYKPETVVEIMNQNFGIRSDS